MLFRAHSLETIPLVRFRSFYTYSSAIRLCTSPDIKQYKVQGLPVRSVRYDNSNIVSREKRKKEVFRTKQRSESTWLMEEESLEEKLIELTTKLRHLRIREAEVLENIDRLTNARGTVNARPIEIEVNGFKRGDRVRITNKVKKPAVWPREKT